jgi:hypothetical protein
MGNNATNLVDPSGLLSDNLQHVPLRDGREAIYYKYERSYFHQVITFGIGTWVESFTDPAYVGVHDPRTGLVRRGKRTVPLESVRGEAARAFTTSDWAAWFVERGTVDGTTNSAWLAMQQAEGASTSRNDWAYGIERYAKPLAYQGITGYLGGGPKINPVGAVSIATPRAVALSKFLGGSLRNAQRDLNGLRSARNLCNARLQTHRSTCGLHVGLSVLEDMAPGTTVSFQGMRNEIAAVGGGGLNQVQLANFIARNAEHLIVTTPRALSEAQLLGYLKRGSVIAAVDRNHWVRIIGSVKQGNRRWLGIYDPARGLYEQELTAFMHRMSPDGGENMILSVRLPGN